MKLHDFGPGVPRGLACCLLLCTLAHGDLSVGRTALEPWSVASALEPSSEATALPQHQRPESILLPRPKHWRPSSWRDDTRPERARRTPLGHYMLRRSAGGEEESDMEAERLEESDSKGERRESASDVERQDHERAMEGEASEAGREAVAAAGNEASDGKEKRERRKSKSPKRQEADEQAHRDLIGSEHLDGEHMSEHLDQAGQDLQSTPDRLRGVEVGRGVEGLSNEFYFAFLHDIRVRRETLYASLAYISFTFIWFLVWYTRLFKDDRLDEAFEPEATSQDPSARSSDHKRASTIERLSAFEDEDESEEAKKVLLSPKMPVFSFKPECSPTASLAPHVHFNPDFVLVFKHPESEQSDDDDIIDKEFVSELFECQKEDWGKSLPRLCGLLKNSEVRMQEVRLALLEDIGDLFLNMGFETFMFSSINDEEVFICCSLLHPDVIYHYVHGEGLDVPLNDSVPGRLGIDIPSSQEDPASAPAYLRFDKRLMERLKTSGIDMTMAELYNLHFLEPGSTERVRMIYRQLTLHFNTKLAEELGILASWFPSHHRQSLHLLRDNWSMQHILNMRQPLDFMQRYFGERLTFIFAWQGHYAKFLIALCVPALVGEIAITTSSQLNWYPSRVFIAVQLPFSIILVIWGFVAFRLWEREQNFLSSKWYCKHNEDHAIVRPEFKGHWGPSGMDRNMQEKQPNEGWHGVKLSLSFLATACCSLLVVTMVNIWYEVWNGRLGVAGSILLAVQMKVFDYTFNSVAERLTNFENHKFQAGHYNSFVIKLFIFYFMNYYYPFMHLLFLQQRSKHGCPEGGCEQELRRQLLWVFLILVLTNIGGALIGEAQVAYRIAGEYARKDRHSHGKEEAGTLTLLEKQRVFGQLREPQQVVFMVQMVVSLGFVLLFGACAPAIVPVCAFFFICHMRIGAFLLTHCMQRPFPWNMAGIGSWIHAIDGMMTLGVLISGYILCFGDMGAFTDASMATKLTSCLLFVFISVAVRGLLNGLLPCPDNVSHLMTVRRKHVAARVNKAALTLQDDVTKRESAPTPRQGSRRGGRDKDKDKAFEGIVERKTLGLASKGWIQNLQRLKQG